MQSSCYFYPKQCGQEDPRGSHCKGETQIPQSFVFKMPSEFLYKLTLHFQHTEEIIRDH